VAVVPGFTEQVVVADWAATVAPVNTPSITPRPSDEEVAAMVGAMEVLWPKSVIAAESASRQRSAWKFSGRWWSQPLPLRRARPWM
jgi:hypothetical protein